MKKYTKRQAQFIIAYENAKYKSVNELYKDPSHNKIRIEYRIREIMEKKNGYDYRVLCGNCMFFTCGYKYRNCDGNTVLRIETYANSYDIEL